MSSSAPVEIIRRSMEYDITQKPPAFSLNAASRLSSLGSSSWPLPTHRMKCKQYEGGRSFSLLNRRNNFQSLKLKMPNKALKLSRSWLMTFSGTSSLLGKKTALLVVDHGSKRPKANEMLLDIAAALQKRTEVPIYSAHMELASPSIADGIRACVEDGAQHVIVLPFFLSPGRHSTTDIPQLTADAIVHFPDVSYDVRPPIGTHPGIIDVILDRAGLL